MSTWAGERYGRGRKLPFGKRGRNAAIDATRLIDAAAVGKLEEHVSDAVSKGATLLHGGRCLTLGEGFYEPRVLAIVTPEMRTAHEVTFGPVVALFRFETDDEAIAKANDTEYGLAAYLYSQDATRLWRHAEGVGAGTVGINCGLISNEVAPVGGVKQSVLGSEGSHLGSTSLQNSNTSAGTGWRAREPCRRHRPQHLPTRSILAFIQNGLS